MEADPEARGGIEPPYSGFANRCITTLLPRHYKRGNASLISPPLPLAHSGEVNSPAFAFQKPVEFR